MLLLCFIAVMALLGAQIVHIVDTRRQNSRSAAFIEAVGIFFSAKDEAGLTNFDKSVHTLAESIGRAQSMSMAASMRGTISGAVRSAEAGLEELAHEQAPQAAMQAAVQQAMTKKLGKNPVAQVGLNFLMQKAMANLGGGQIPQGGNGNSGGNVADVFKL